MCHRANSDLAGVDRAVTPWVVAHFHRPFYCATGNSHCMKESISQPVEDAMYFNKVDLVIVGHVHAYERTYPVYNHSSTTGAPIYIMQGASGNREGNDGAYPPLDQLPEWTAAVHNEIGYGIMTLSADQSTMGWKFFESNGNAELDAMTVQKTK